ncbi:MAG: hypothetical protein JXD19_03165 [Deltaproteobacteria bacterium]|nr:hypothetical protein [Deltaproteobacteria bacterium]
MKLPFPPGDGAASIRVVALNYRHEEIPSPHVSFVAFSLRAGALVYQTASPFRG